MQITKFIINMGRIKQAFQSLRNKVTGRPQPSAPKAGYTSDGRRYGCGGKVSKKKK